MRPLASEADLKKLARRTFIAYGRDTVDFLQALRCVEATVAQRFELAPGYQARFAEILRGGQGAILVTGHFGNWEIGSVLMSRVLHLPLTIVAMAEADARVNDMRREIRAQLGVETIEVRQSFDTALRLRRQLAGNGIVAMLMDRHFGRDRVRVTMFDRPVWFLRTPALLGYLTGAPLLPCFIHRTNGQRHVAMVGEPIVVDTQGTRDESIQRAAQQFADQLARQVHAHPEYWYHFYRYWDAQRDVYTGLE